MPAGACHTHHPACREALHGGPKLSAIIGMADGLTVPFCPRRGTLGRGVRDQDHCHARMAEIVAGAIQLRCPVSRFVSADEALLRPFSEECPGKLDAKRTAWTIVSRDEQVEAKPRCRADEHYAMPCSLTVCSFKSRKLTSPFVVTRSW